MSTVIILTPIIVANWPLIASAITAAAVGMGLTAREQVKEILEEEQTAEQAQNSIVVDVENSEVLAQSLARGKEIVLTQGNIELKISRDDRGSIQVCASGMGHTKTELENVADEFVKKMTQCYVYNRTMTELKNKKFQVVNEEVMNDGSVRINVRRFAD